MHGVSIVDLHWEGVDIYLGSVESAVDPLVCILCSSWWSFQVPKYWEISGFRYANVCDLSSVM